MLQIICCIVNWLVDAISISVGVLLIAFHWKENNIDTMFIFKLCTGGMHFKTWAVHLCLSLIRVQLYCCTVSVF